MIRHTISRFQSLSKNPQFSLGVSLVIVFCCATFFIRAGACYKENLSSYTRIEELPSPDGRRNALIFREEDNGINTMRHVRIVDKDEKFDPNLLSGTRVHYYWQEQPHFEFSILKPIKVHIKWEDNYNLLISFPLDNAASTFQQSKGVSTKVNVHYEFAGQGL